MNTLFLKTLTSALNGYLRLDPESATRLAHLQGKRAAIELRPFNYHFECLFTPNGVCLSEGTARKEEPGKGCDVHITGTPLSLAGMMLNPKERQQFFANDVKMVGDAEVGMEIVDLFDSLQIDWEEPLSQCIGDAPTHYVKQGLQRIKNWFGHADQSMTDNVRDYVQEEAGWLPTREALNDLFNDIDQLQMDVERMVAMTRSFAAKNAAQDDNPTAAAE